MKNNSFGLIEFIKKQKMSPQLLAWQLPFPKWRIFPRWKTYSTRDTVTHVSHLQIIFITFENYLIQGDYIFQENLVWHLLFHLPFLFAEWFGTQLTSMGLEEILPCNKKIRLTQCAILLNWNFKWIQNFHPRIYLS